MMDMSESICTVLQEAVGKTIAEVLPAEGSHALIVFTDNTKVMVFAADYDGSIGAKWERDWDEGDRDTAKEIEAAAADDEVAAEVDTGEEG